MSDPIGRGCATVRDTVVVARVDTIKTAPDTVYIKSTRVVRDTLYKERVDSLIAQTANKDSLIRDLAEPREGQEPFSMRAVTPQGDSLTVTGLALIDCRPLDHDHTLVLTPNPIYLAARDTTIFIYQTTEVLDTKGVVVSIVGGALIGAGLTWYFSK